MYIGSHFKLFLSILLLPVFFIFLLAADVDFKKTDTTEEITPLVFAAPKLLQANSSTWSVITPLGFHVTARTHEITPSVFLSLLRMPLSMTNFDRRCGAARVPCSCGN